MKKIMILVLTIFLCGCGTQGSLLTSDNIVDYIKTPSESTLTIKGTWRLSESLYLGEGEDPGSFDTNLTQNNTILMSEDFVGMFGRYAAEPRFKSKMVNATAFSIQQYRKNPADIGIHEEDIEVLSIEGENQFRFSLIVLDLSHIRVSSGGYLHTFEKISEEINPTLIDELVMDQTGEGTIDPNATGNEETLLLLGVRSAQSSESSIAPEYMYKTILLHVNPNDTVDVSSIQNLIIPRRDELWEVSSTRMYEDESIRDEIKTRPLAREKTAEDTTPKIEETAQVIHYVNENFLSLEKIYSGEISYTQYNTYAFDQFGTGVPLDITMIAGDVGSTELTKNAQNEASIMKASNDNLEIQLPSTQDWGIIRRNGRWIFRSMIRAIEDNTSVRKTFDINILPTTQIFSNNENGVSWTQVKERHPSAIDVVASPNQKIIAIQDTYRLYIYRIEDGYIAQEPLQVVRIRTNDRIVMAEWAVDTLVPQWLNLFSNVEYLPQSD